MKKQTGPIYLVIFVLLLDCVTKFLTLSFLPKIQSYWYPYGGIGVFRNFLGIEFSIIHATNKGAAWGLLAEFQEYLLLLRIICIVGIIIYMLFYNQNRLLNWPCALIIAGALGNVLDYFFYGHVIDMFHFIFWGYSYPVFNVADSAICIGIMWLLFFTSATKRKRAS